MATPVKYPGPKAQAALSEMLRYVKCDPWPFQVQSTKCHGMYIATTDDQEVFDWSGLYGSLLLTYNHPEVNTPEVREALANAAVKRFPNPDFLTPECLGYYRMLMDIAPRCLANPKMEVYVINSGAEAVENMMKYLLYLHRHNIEAQGKKVKAQRFIYFDASYHGRTVFTLNVTHLKQEPASTENYGGLATDNIRIDFPFVDNDQTEEENDARTDDTLATIESAMKMFADDIVAVLLEPLQGAGGNRMVQPRFMRELSLLCKEHNIYYAFDEVQTSGGCCGDMWAADLFDLPHPPMAIASAKKMGCGVVYMRETYGDLGLLDSTWGGSLPDMVRLQKEMEIIKNHNLIAQVADKTAHLVRGLKQLQSEFPQHMSNVRGLGLYQGWTMPAESKAAFWEIALQEFDLFFLGAGPTVIRLRPPIDVTTADIDELIKRTRGALTVLAQRLGK